MPKYGDDFVANMILLHRSGAAVTRGELTDFATMSARSAGSRDVCGGNDTSTVDEDGAVREADFSAILLPDVYYSDSSRKLINYGSLGTLLAGEVLDAAASRVDLSAHASCLARYVDANMGVALDEVRTSWAAYVVHHSCEMPCGACLAHLTRTRFANSSGALTSLAWLHWSGRSRTCCGQIYKAFAPS